MNPSPLEVCKERLEEPWRILLGGTVLPFRPFSAVYVTPSYVSAHHPLPKGMGEMREEQLHPLTSEHHVIPSDSSSSVEPTTPAGPKQ